MKILSSYYGCHKVQIAPAYFFQDLDKGRLWWYNILRDNNGIISYLIPLDPITSGSVSITAGLVFLKRENPEPILTVKLFEWRKFIDYFGLNIEAVTSKVDKKEVWFVRTGYIPSPSSGQPHIESHQPEKVKFGYTKATSVPTNKKYFRWDCASHIFCLERPGCDFWKSILSSSPKFGDVTYALDWVGCS